MTSPNTEHADRQVTSQINGSPIDPEKFHKVTRSIKRKSSPEFVIGKAYHGDPDSAVSAFFRFRALCSAVEENKLGEFQKSAKKSKSFKWLHVNVIKAAATTQLVDPITFDYTELLKTARDMSKGSVNRA